MGTSVQDIGIIRVARRNSSLVMGNHKTQMVANHVINKPCQLIRRNHRRTYK